MEFRRVLFRSERHARGGQIVRSRDLGHRDAGRAGLSNRVQSAPSTHLEGAMSATIRPGAMRVADWRTIWRSDEHTYAIPSPMRIADAGFCLNTQKNTNHNYPTARQQTTRVT